MLTLIQLNIEESRHLGRIIPFLEERQPNILCLQELNKKDIPHILDALSETTTYVFSPMMHTSDGTVIGIGIFSSHPLQETFVLPYTNPQGQEYPRDNTDIHTKHATETRIVTGADIETDEGMIRILTTHFTWSTEGKPDDYQRNDMTAMLSILDTLGDFVLTGDFNAPRGGEIFALLTKKYTDNVPPKYKTSIDGNLHKAGPLPYMVDGIFSTSAYDVTNVEMICGVSDHCALIAQITKKS